MKIEKKDPFDQRTVLLGFLRTSPMPPPLRRPSFRVVTIHMMRESQCRSFSSSSSFSITAGGLFTISSGLLPDNNNNNNNNNMMRESQSLSFSGRPMFSENNLMLYQQDLQLGTYFVKWQLVIDQGLPRFPITYFAK